MSVLSANPVLRATGNLSALETFALSAILAPLLSVSASSPTAVLSANPVLRAETREADHVNGSDVFPSLGQRQQKAGTDSVRDSRVDAPSRDTHASRHLHAGYRYRAGRAHAVDVQIEQQHLGRRL